MINMYSGSKFMYSGSKFMQWMSRLNGLCSWSELYLMDCNLKERYMCYAKVVNSNKYQVFSSSSNDISIVC
jgi:hypothetical protein